MPVVSFTTVYTNSEQRGHPETSAHKFWSKYLAAVLMIIKLPKDFNFLTFWIFLKFSFIQAIFDNSYSQNLVNGQFHYIYVMDKVWDFKEVNALKCIPNLILQINLIPKESSQGES